LQVGVGIRGPRFGAIELLGMQIFQAGQQLEAQKRTKGKSDLRLTMGIDVVAIHLHLGRVAQQTGDHGRDFGGGTAFELRIDTGGRIVGEVDHQSERKEYASVD
jgi:hypothetical protein